jgi:hypothetical protein
VPNPLTYILATALGCALFAHAAHSADFENAQSASQILNKRDKACEGLKGSALEQCLSDYVGPVARPRYGRDSVYAKKRYGLPEPKPWKSEGGPTKPGRQ